MTFLPQMVPLQTLPTVQSVLSRQLTRQVPVAPHMYSLQVSEPPVAHVPAPSHFQGAAPTDPPVGQVGSLQMVAFEEISQPPKPSQNPSVPQVTRPLSAHWPRGSERAGTG